MKTHRLLLAALAASPCLAQTPATPLDPIVVTATGAQARLSEIAASVHVIDRAEIERAQADDLADLLRGMAGVDVARSGPPGSPASVFIRGADSNHTLFLVDGVRYTTETFLNAQIQNLAPEMIERIEILKGPRSALWGSDAIGGVVHVITRRAPAGITASGSARAGSFGTRDVGAFVGYGAETGRFALSAEAQGFDGFPPLQGGAQDRGHDNLNAAVNGDLAIGPARLALRHMHADGTNEYADFFAGAPRAQNFENRVSAAELAAEAGAWRTRITASLAHDAIVQHEPSDPARPQRFDSTQVTRRALEWDSRLDAGAYALTAGAATSTSEIDSVFFSALGDAATRDRSERHALFAQAEGTAGATGLLLAGRYTDHNAFGGHATGQAELTQLVGDSRVGLAFGTAFKEPELTDLYGAFGNPGLAPERSASAEVNLRQPLAPHQVLTAAVFETRLRDLIAFDFATFRPANVQRARIRGIEAAWRYEDARWNAWLSGHWQDPRDRDSGARLLRRTRESAQAGLGRRFGPLHAQLELLACGSRNDVAGARLSGYALVNAAVSYAHGTRWSLALRGENLLDADYELVDGFRTAGASGYATLRASF